MNSRSSLYKFVFITNAAACILFIGLAVYTFFFRKPTTMKDGDAIGVLILIIVLSVYLINDIIGLSFVKKLNLNESISRSKRNWPIIALCVMAVLEVFISVAFYYGSKNMLKGVKDASFFKTYYPVLIVYFILLIILITGIYNFFSIIRLLKKMNTNNKLFNEQIYEIGSRL